MNNTGADCGISDNRAAAEPLGRSGNKRRTLPFENSLAANKIQNLRFAYHGLATIRRASCPSRWIKSPWLFREARRVASWDDLRFGAEDVAAGRILADILRAPRSRRGTHGLPSGCMSRTYTRHDSDGTVLGVSSTSTTEYFDPPSGRTWFSTTTDESGNVATQRGVTYDGPHGGSETVTTDRSNGTTRVDNVTWIGPSAGARLTTEKDADGNVRMNTKGVNFQPRRGQFSAAVDICLRNRCLDTGVLHVVTHASWSASPPVVGMRFGYTRVSTVAQTLHQQHDSLKAAGASKIYSDTMSGARDDRPGLAALMDQLRR
jgi:hypothetical protein